MNTTPNAPRQGNPRIYLLHPLPAGRVHAGAGRSRVAPAPAPITAVIDPAKPMLKLGLDVHLEFIMAVAQKDHAAPHAPRKFSNDQLVAPVTKWRAEPFDGFRRVHVRREGAPNRSRGGCAPHSFHLHRPGG